MNEYKAKIRKNVIQGHGESTSEFSEFIVRCQGNVEIKNKEFSIGISLPDEIIFECEEDFVLYQLTFDEIDPIKVILPIIRRVMSASIANEIIGVQPMSGAAAQIHTMRLRYS